MSLIWRNCPHVSKKDILLSSSCYKLLNHMVLFTLLYFVPWQGLLKCWKHLSHWNTKNSNPNSLKVKNIIGEHSFRSPRSNRTIWPTTSLECTRCASVKISWVCFCVKESFIIKLQSFLLKGRANRVCFKFVCRLDCYLMAARKEYLKVRFLSRDRFRLLTKGVSLVLNIKI